MLFWATGLGPTMSARRAPPSASSRRAASMRETREPDRTSAQTAGRRVTQDHATRMAWSARPSDTPPVGSSPTVHRPGACSGPGCALHSRPWLLPRRVQPVAQGPALTARAGRWQSPWPPACVHEESHVVSCFEHRRHQLPRPRHPLTERPGESLEAPACRRPTCSIARPAGHFTAVLARVRAPACCILLTTEGDPLLLRRAVADRRGLETPADDLLITSGSQQGVVAQALLVRGGTAVFRPGR